MASAPSSAAQRADGPPEEGSRVWVGGLPSNVEEASLKEKFGRFGKIEFVVVRRTQRDTYAFIQFFSAENARTAVMEMDQSAVFSKECQGTASRDHDSLERRGTVVKVALAKARTDPKGGLGGAARGGSGGRRRSGSRSSGRSRSRSSGRSRSRSRSRSRDGSRSRSHGRSRSRSRSQSKRSGSPRRSASRPRVDKEKGPGGRARKVIRLRIERLPPDFTEQELSDLGAGFGDVVYVRMWRYKEVTYGNLIYKTFDEAVKAMAKLHGRKVAGWSETLRVHIPCWRCHCSIWDPCQA